MELFREKTQTGFRKLHFPDMQQHIKAASENTLLSLKSLSPPAKKRHGKSDYSTELIVELQNELHQVSVELAASIKRELDLEMLLDSFISGEDADLTLPAFAELTDASSSTIDDTDDDEHDQRLHARRENGDPYRQQVAMNFDKFQELERKLRSEQQEKARLRIEYQNIMERERRARLDVEERKASLEAILKSRATVSPAAPPDTVDTEAVRSLETALEDTQRKLHNERLNAQNLEYMLNGMLEEIKGMAEKPSDEQIRRVRQSVVSFAKLQVSNFDGTGITRNSSGTGNEDAADVEALKTKISSLEEQRDVLQQALRGLRERHELSERQTAEREKMLQSQLQRAKDIAHTVSTKRHSCTREILTVKDSVEQLKGRLVSAQQAKSDLEAGLKTIKMRLASIDSASFSASAAIPSLPPSSRDANNSAPPESELRANYASALTLIEELNSRLQRNSNDMHALTAQFERERQETKTLVSSLEDRVAKAEQQQRIANDLAEEHKMLLRTLSFNRRQMKDEHSKMTYELESSTRRLQEFASEIQKHVESSKTFTSKFASDLAPTAESSNETSDETSTITSIPETSA
ncbi:hypothetical protein V1511DRAFT_463348 [Dipodascopsis uninucleata]